MQEFKDAMVGLNAVLVEEKRKVAARCRPIFLQTFKAFFETNPEIAALKFRVETNYYNDEEYSDRVMNGTYELEPEFLAPGFEPCEDFQYELGYGPLSEVSQYDIRHAKGEFDDYSRRHYPETLPGRQAEAKSRIDTSEIIDAKMGRDRRYALYREIVRAIETIENSDMEFFKIVLGENVDVTISKEGITVV